MGPLRCTVVLITEMDTFASDRCIGAAEHAWASSKLCQPCAVWVVLAVECFRERNIVNEIQYCSE